jgi:hypothetical protein
MDTKKLREWIDEKKIRNHAIEGFWLNMDSYRVDEPEEFNELFWDYKKEDLKITIEDISLHIKNSTNLESELEYVEAKVRIEFRMNHIGYYRIIFNLDGRVEDDYFISEWTGLRLYQTRAILEDIKEEIEAEQISGLITDQEAKRIKEIIEVKKEQIRKSIDIRT